MFKTTTVLRVAAADIKGSYAQIRAISTSQANLVNQKWRQERGLPLNPNSCGVLTDLPDYTFKDGRPTPYMRGQFERLRTQQELAEQVIQLTREVDFAVENHEKRLDEEQKRKEHILTNKLKPKGVQLLKKTEKTK